MVYPVTLLPQSAGIDALVSPTASITTTSSSLPLTPTALRDSLAALESMVHEAHEDVNAALQQQQHTASMLDEMSAVREQIAAQAQQQPRVCTHSWCRTVRIAVVAGCTDVADWRWLGCTRVAGAGHD